MDLLPFGELTEGDQELLWPPEGDFRMSTHGFAEAMDSAWMVRIHNDPICDIQVANPVAVIALKLVAWTERDRGIRKKDIQDIEYIIKNYAKVPIIEDALYEDGYMAKYEHDQELATAAYLGKELGVLILPNTREYLRTHIINNQKKFEEMQREMENPISIEWFKLLFGHL